MKHVWVILWLCIVAALCGYMWGCAPAHPIYMMSDEKCVPGPMTKYPIVTKAKGCDDKGNCGIWRIEEDKFGVRKYEFVKGKNEFVKEGVE